MCILRNNYFLTLWKLILHKNFTVFFSINWIGDEDNQVMTRRIIIKIFHQSLNLGLIWFR